MNRFLFLCSVFVGSGIYLILVPSLAQAAAPNSTKWHIAGAAINNNRVSCFVRLGDKGPVLGVSEEFWNSQPCANAAQPITQEWVSFDIKYPEMIPGSWAGAMDRYLTHDLGSGKPTDQFSARIVWIFFADEIPHTFTDRWHGPEPQVWQQIENAKKLASYAHPYPSPIIGLSEIKGLRMIKFGDPLQPPPAALERLKAEGWTQAKDEGAFIEIPEADYEVFAGCDQAFACEGSVRLKSSHIQYRFLIPLRAKLQMANFISATNDLIRSWIHAK